MRYVMKRALSYVVPYFRPIFVIDLIILVQCSIATGECVLGAAHILVHLGNMVYAIGRIANKFEW